MKQRTAARLAWSLGAVAVAAIVAGVVFQLISPPDRLPENLRLRPAEIFDSLTNLGLPLLGALVASRRSEISLGWLFLLAGLGLALSSFGTAYAAYGLLVNPGSVPAPNFMGWLSNWSWTLAVGSLPLLLLLFPTGRLHSRRWRPVGWIAAVCFGALVVVSMVFVSFGWTQPWVQDTSRWSVPSWLEPLFFGAFFVVSALAPLALASTLLRFKRARGEERLQLKWFVAAAAFFVANLVVELFVENAVQAVAFSLGALGLWVAIGVAILKYRLYDIDIVINKAVVFGALAAFFTAVYVAIVVGIGALVGSQANTFLTILAAVLIAVAFHPIRERARHLANRLVYGRRASPYEVLSHFSERMTAAYATEDLPARMAEILGQGTGATRADVWLAVGGVLRAEASWPSGGGRVESIAIRDGEVPTPQDADAFIPVRHQGELLGALSVEKPPNEPVNPAEEKLIADLASQAGLVLRNVRLIEELRASRQRLVKAQDEERRRLERNIHDGAQQQLVALGVRLGLLGTLAAKTAPELRLQVDELRAETQDALENLRDLARGIYPPLLSDQGLEAALRSQARKASVPVEVEADSIGRYPQELEAAVYFCVLEALQNVAKYGEASRALVRLSARNGALTFEVSDDGRGFDPKSTGYGTGLQGMADRLDAIGGSLEVRSGRGQGTTVTGSVPARPQEAAT